MSTLNIDGIGFSHNDLADVATRLRADGHEALADEYQERADTEEKVYLELRALGQTARSRTAEGMDAEDLGARLARYLFEDGWTPPAHFNGRNDDRLDARRTANLVRDVRDAEAPGHTVQIDGVKIAKCDTRGLTDEERASYERGLREGRLDNSVVRAEVVGSAEWLRDLADRLQQHNADRGGVLDPEHGAETPYLLREHADQVAPAWDDLSEAERAHSLDRHLEVYRAGRADQEATDA